MTDRGVSQTGGDDPAGAFEDFVDAVLDLLRAARRVGGARAARGEGISVPQLVMLSAVDVVGERGVSAVADQAGLAQPTVTRALAALERRGLVRRFPHASDGRTTSLALTPTGRTVLGVEKRQLIDRFTQVWKTLGPDERNFSLTLVRRLALIADDLV